MMILYNYIERRGREKKVCCVEYVPLPPKTAGYNMPNRLSDASSPYLRQHANNPVDWYPWTTEALETARSKNKPILLSIGYAACHWCHVMAHESFEDAKTANLMNEHFINIKVDREERPDLDKIYQTAHQILTNQAGGWPLTIFLTPDDLTPFFSGTYFPKEVRYQLPAFQDVLRGLAAAYQNRYTEIKQQNAELQRILQHQPASINDLRLSAQPIQLGLSILQRMHDKQYGGFGHAPKFPQVPILNFIAEHDATILQQTLTNIAAGGIYDQLGGGFFRYTVDAKWEIPHFEKMLYDNGLLLALYAQHASSEYNSLIQSTADWALRDMQASHGGFYTSLDADSDGHEGLFYVWQRDAIQAALTQKEFNAVNLRFGLNQPPNFENQYWHLHVDHSVEEMASQLAIPEAEAETILRTATQKLFVTRNQRTPPFRDEKILTAWNALMIKGLLLAGYRLNSRSYITTSQHGIDFIRTHLWKNKRLFASFQNGNPQFNAYLDDYVFLIDALLTSLQVDWRSEDLYFAIALTEAVITHFSDKAHGGFYFTSDDHESLLYRPKTNMDDAIPAGNGIAAQVLQTLGYLLGETRYLRAAEKTLQHAWPMLSQHPAEHSSLLLALKHYLQPKPMVVIRGSDRNEMDAWKASCWSPQHFIVAITDDANLPEALAAKLSSDKTCAYICTGMQCSQVINDIHDLHRQLAITVK
jgi:uncharacterized protein YyaL (SSP411 family)